MSNHSNKKYPERIFSAVSTEQMQQIREDAYASGMSVSRFIRHRATGQRVASKTDIRILSELRRIGGLLKMLGMKGENTAPALDELTKTVRALQE